MKKNFSTLFIFLVITLSVFSQSKEAEAVKLYEQKSLEASRVLFQEVVDEDPKNANAIEYLGNIAFDRQQYRKAADYIKDRNCRLVGPNCPGVITPGEAKVGIMPGFVFKKGKVGVVSKSGTLTYEAADQVVKQGLGITTAIGIGGDPIIGTTTKEAIELLINDPETEAVVMIGEIGGQLEADAANWYKASGSKKPIVGFIAGETAPAGRTMGHAGAIVGGSDDTAQAKKKIMRECGIHVVDSPAEIGKKVAEVLG